MLDKLAREYKAEANFAPQCKKAPESAFLPWHGTDQEFWMTMLGNLELWSTARSPTLTATRRAIWR